MRKPLNAIILAMAVLTGVGAANARAAEPAGGTAWTEPASGITFVWIPSGSFEMGCQAQDGHCPESELPLHRREVPGFWLSRTLITQGQWKRLMDSNPSRAKKGDDYPVDQVNWYDAQEIIGRLNRLGHGRFRLPSEAEWEYACRAGSPTDLYCGGNDPAAVAWGMHNARLSTMPVAQKAANGFGLFDMSGNLWEWTADCWTDSYAGAPTDASARGEAQCEARALRGGSWGNHPPQLRASTRRKDTDVKCPYIGLRIARDQDR